MEEKKWLKDFTDEELKLLRSELGKYIEFQYRYSPEGCGMHLEIKKQTLHITSSREEISKIFPKRGPRFKLMFLYDSLRVTPCIKVILYDKGCDIDSWNAGAARNLSVWILDIKQAIANYCSEDPSIDEVDKHYEDLFKYDEIYDGETTTEVLEKLLKEAKEK